MGAHLRQPDSQLAALGVSTPADRACPNTYGAPQVVCCSAKGQDYLPGVGYKASENTGVKDIGATVRASAAGESANLNRRRGLAERGRNRLATKLTMLGYSYLLFGPRAEFTVHVWRYEGLTQSRPCGSLATAVGHTDRVLKQG